MNMKSLHILTVVATLIVMSASCALPASPQVPTTAIPTPGRSATVMPTITVALPSVTFEPTAPQGPIVEQVTFFLVALEDQGQGGILVGCGDSLVEVTQPVEPTTEPIKAALERLFSFKTQTIGQSGLYTALYQSDLTVISAVVSDDEVAKVELSGTYRLGGVCDNPRFQGQIEHTILASSNARSVEVTIDGVPLKEIVSGQ